MLSSTLGQKQRLAQVQVLVIKVFLILLACFCLVLFFNLHLSAKENDAIMHI